MLILGIFSCHGKLLEFIVRVFLLFRRHFYFRSRLQTLVYSLWKLTLKTPNCEPFQHNKFESRSRRIWSFKQIVLVLWMFKRGCRGSRVLVSSNDRLVWSHPMTALYDYKEWLMNPVHSGNESMWKYMYLNLNQSFRIDVNSSLCPVFLGRFLFS